MNPLTNVKNINKLNEIEADLGTAGGKTSWHEQYKDSAYIFIGGLPYDLTEGDVICVFSQYGEIVNINLVRDKKSGKSKGYCFLAYEDQRSTILAVDNFNGIKLLGRVLRVDHVSDYRKPKEDENDDEVTKMLRQEGCAPKVLSPPVSEEGDSEDYQIPTKKVKKEHKQKSRSHEKKKKKKKHKKHSSKSRADSSDSESSQSEEERSVHKVQVKREIDRGYECNVKRERKQFDLDDEFTQQRAGDKDRLQHRSYDQQDRRRDAEHFSRSRSRDEHREHEKYRDRSRDRPGHQDKHSHRKQERSPSPLPEKSFRNLERSSDSSRNLHRDSNKEYKDRSDRGSYKNWHREQEEGRGRSRDYYSKRD